jgi:bifunctional non-homologous end joining protein LigD
MLARCGRLPADPGYVFELKWDGFRALVRCGSEFRVRSRRGWNMTDLLPELAPLPVDAVLDGDSSRSVTKAGRTSRRCASDS